MYVVRIAHVGSIDVRSPANNEISESGDEEVIDGLNLNPGKLLLHTLLLIHKIIFNR